MARYRDLQGRFISAEVLARRELLALDRVAYWLDVASAARTEKAAERALRLAERADREYSHYFSQRRPEGGEGDEYPPEEDIYEIEIGVDYEP